VAWETLYRQLCDQGDDLALLLAKGALDPEQLTVDFYADQVQGSLDRLSSSHLDEIGVTRTGPVEDGTRQVVKFTSGRRTRLAVVEDRDRVKLGSSHGDDWYTNGGMCLVSWVDHDFEQFAERVQHERFGTIKEVDASSDDPLAQLPQVQEWARDPWSV